MIKGKIPLARYFSKCGVMSRSQSVLAIKQKRVAVNGRVITEPEYLISPDQAKITLDGEEIQKPKTRTIMLHKPRGFVTTRSDEKGRKTVYECLSDINVFLAPVGRLDQYSSGLLLFTNNTKLSEYLTSPLSSLEKTYVVVIDGRLTEKDLSSLESGVIDEGEELKAKKIEVIKSSGRESTLKVVLTQGKNREIRRMMKAKGYEVQKLKRISIGKLELGTLEIGKWRELDEEELKSCFPNYFN